MAFGMLDAEGTFDLAILIKIQFDLRHVHGKRAASKAGLAHLHGQFMHAKQEIAHLVAPLFAKLIRTRQKLIHLFIIQPHVAVDGRVVHFGVRDRQIIEHLDLGRLHQSNAIGLQACQVVADDFRDHRNHAVRQVDTGRAFLRFFIQRTSEWHKLADVGNVNPKSPSSFFTLE